MLHYRQSMLDLTITRGCHNDSKPHLLIFICVLAISQEPLLMNGESENRQYQI